MEHRQVGTICKFCGKQCHLIAEISPEGNIGRIKPDPAYKTVWCATGKNGLQLMNHPERIRLPLKRVGEKGTNHWQTISWEQAFSEIGAKFKTCVDTYGPNAFLGIRGYNKPYFNMIYERLINTIGTVNSMGAANMCHMAGMSAARETFGFMPNPVITADTRFIVLWGSNPYNTDKSMAAKVEHACSRQAKLIVIDPCCTHHAKKADIWLPLKPGTDMALALGMINVIIQNGWYEQDFIEKCTYGFDKMKECVNAYPVEKTAEITGVSVGQITAAAKIMALYGPGIFDIGNAMDHNVDGFQKCRAINILMAITGNVDREGALTARGAASAQQIAQRKQISRSSVCPFHDPEKRRQMVGYQDSFLDGFHESSGKALADALNTGLPYSIKAAYVQGGNPAMVWENREELVKAFCKLDFMVVSDFFITPTAMLADIVLPAAVYMEYESVVIEGDGTICYSPNLVPDATAKSDLEIINKIGKAMGYDAYFWETMDGYWEEFLNPFGVTLEQIRREKLVSPKHDQAETVYGYYRENGFPTVSGKINLYSDTMRAKGNDPIPVYYNYAATTKEYPYLSTNYKSEYFYHTAGRQIKEQREQEPEAIALVSLDIAEKEKLKEGDLAMIFTAAGSVRQQVHIEEHMAAGTIALAHGWWYPEREKSPFVLESCSNNLVFADRLIGKELPAFTTRGLPCNVKRAEKERSTV